MQAQPTSQKTHGFPKSCKKRPLYYHYYLNSVASPFFASSLSAGVCAPLHYCSRDNFLQLGLIVTQTTSPHSIEFPPPLKVFFLLVPHHSLSRPLYPLRSLKYYPLTRDRKGCSSLTPPFSSQLSLLSCHHPHFLPTLTSVVPQHFNGSTHLQLACSSPSPAGWLDI